MKTKIKCHKILLIILAILIFHCKPKFRNRIDLFGSFYQNETLVIEANGKTLLKKRFTKEPLQIYNDTLNLSEDLDSIKLHIYTLYNKKKIIDTTIVSANISNYHLLFSFPFRKNKGNIGDSSNNTPSIDSSVRVVNLINENSDWNDIRK